MLSNLATSLAKRACSVQATRNMNAIITTFGPMHNENIILNVLFHTSGAQVDEVGCGLAYEQTLMYGDQFWTLELS